MQTTTYTCDYCGDEISKEQIDRHLVVHATDYKGILYDYHVSCCQNKKVEDELDAQIQSE
jgi:hypothetical protein